MEVQLLKFVGLVKYLKTDGGAEDKISSEYDIVRSRSAAAKQTAGFTTEIGALKDNVKKNRYKDILPYDQNRVVLTLQTEKGDSDYINASFVQGSTKNRVYIAAQAPLSHTLVDFWRMVWQYDVKVIIMACRETELGKKKCERYWAAHTKTSVFGPFAVSNMDESCPNEEVIVRILSVKYQDEIRTLSQFQYTAWPDHGIPRDSDGILGMMAMAHNAQGNSAVPIVIHCSAGCGRTGVICTVDFINDLLLTKRVGENFNIMDIVTEIRKQRPSAVQTKEQYEFIYHTVLQLFEKALLTYDAYQNVSQIHPASNDDEFSVKKQNQLTLSCDTGKAQTKRKPSAPPRTSDWAGLKMNDTYAIVNKPKHRTPPDPASPSPTSHLYDNLELGKSASPTTALYSAVKTKKRGTGNPALSASAIDDRAEMASCRGEGRGGNYELIPGDFPSPSRNPMPVNLATSRSSESLSSSDEDYEYVSDPLKTILSSHDGNIGFNFRIKKPKGPRDPPAEWSRAEL